jgi:hypothetical protein
LANFLGTCEAKWFTNAHPASRELSTELEDLESPSKEELSPPIFFEDLLEDTTAVTLKESIKVHRDNP